LAQTRAENHLQDVGPLAVESGEWLVAKEQLGAVAEGPRDDEALARPPPQDADRVGAAAEKAHLQERRAEFLQPRRGIVEPGIEGQVLPDAQVVVEERLMRE